MEDRINMIKLKLKDEIKKAAREAGYSDLVDFDISYPPDPKMGDFATNIALVIGAENKINPKELAQKIGQKLEESQIIDQTNIAGAGFINIVINPHIYYQELKKILSEKNNYGRSSQGTDRKVSIDYISANPTGPVHIGNARGGPIGETISNLLEFCGYKVSREFYVNDVGVQIIRLGETLYYWIEQENQKNLPFPEGGYQGEYLAGIAEQIQTKYQSKLTTIKNKGEVIQFLVERGMEILINNIKEEVALLNIKFDRWVLESEIQKSGLAKKTIARLKEADATVNFEGAVWFKNPTDPKFEDKESVLVKSDEEKSFTYFADDLAYHIDRYDKGFDLIVDLWGANHHGHIPRMKSALLALGISEDRIQILLYQFIRLKNGEEILRMSKRLGNFVTLRQVLDGGVSPDAFKYFILSQNMNTPFDFDIELAKEQSEKNPVYYIQYAHARIESILRKAGDIEIAEADLSLLKSDKEIHLIKALTLWPDIVEETAGNFQVQSLPHYAYKLATLFHDFYTNCQVLSDDKKLTASRLSLIRATQIVLKNVLSICGITAPEKM